MKFTIWGKPKAKGRPRLSTYNGFARAYTPKDTIEYENLIKLSYLQASETQEKLEYEKPISLKVVAYYQIPKSVSKISKEKMLNGEILPCVKPDIDNILKSVLDSLNKIAFKDDTQVVRLFATKYYSEQPRVEVEITNYENND